MSIQRKDRKKFFIFLIAFLVIAIISLYNRVFAMKHYQEVDFSTGLVTASTLNVRQGPGLNFKVISKVYKDNYIRVFAKIGNWYVVQIENDIIGTVYADYVKPIYRQAQTTNAEAEEKMEVQEVKEVKETQEVEETKETVAQPVENVVEEKFDNNANIAVSNKAYNTELTDDEKEVLNIINEKRAKEGLNPLVIDDDVQNICRLKAQDMVEKDYFEHNSPTYGTAFDMLKDNGVNYKVAAENIAGNSSNEKAIDAWMNSENHKSNILNKSYNYTGIAVVKSPKYGKIYVEIFIGK